MKIGLIIVNNKTGERFLCPTYDHAASLGRELLDDEREERLNTRDKNRKIERFICKARSELFNLKTDKKRKYSPPPLEKGDFYLIKSPLTPLF